MVAIDTFLALDIRIGKIISVEEHEKARKPMYKLTVDLGPEIGRRVIVAGIRSNYSKDELVNKRIACIVNLDPKVIAGIESQGMLLAAGEGENVALLVPDREIAQGAQIH
ncbi:MAG: tRNA-binding protein [Candidatus Micrarchaeota archaeon]|nr:tRNA-binding protein [Candidatus Micrarchaeota archaeon]MDE1834154.1 tRNA-binding protein [Candidatus Micrarchaeota archaeon]MDE1859008.1 tRNA-binding protein [Candidatus Micrarchaeota archaeon]